MPFYIGAVPEVSDAHLTPDGIRLRDLIGATANNDFLDKPHVQYTERQPGHVTRPHFHVVDQFQFYLGTAKLGKAPVRPGMVQYTRAHTPYGPILTGDNGLIYIVMRAKGDPGAKNMPESRPLLRKVKPRNDILEIDLESKTETHEGPFDGGLELTRRRIEAGAPVEFTAPRESGGQFGVVLEGSVLREGKSYPVWSTAFVDPGETEGGLQAGPEGADVLYLRLPVPLPEEGT